MASPLERRLTLRSLVVGGLMSTAAAIDLGIVMYVREPGKRERLEAGAAGVAAFVDEVLRHQSPAIFTSIPRIAVRPFQVGEIVLEAGTDVRPLLASANRDPDAFELPDHFLPERFAKNSDRSDRATASMTFGMGDRLCPGARLASIQVGAVLTAIHRRLPTMGLARNPTVRRLPVARTFVDLPVHRVLRVPMPRGGRRLVSHPSAPAQWPSSGLSAKLAVGQVLLQKLLAESQGQIADAAAVELLAGGQLVEKRPARAEGAVAPAAVRRPPETGSHPARQP